MQNMEDDYNEIDEMTEAEYWAQLTLLAENGENLFKNPNSLQARTLIAILKFAVAHSVPSVIVNVLRTGVGVDYEVRPGVTILMLCIEQDKPELVRQLVELNANVNKQTSVTDSPLHYAIEKNKIRAAESLFAAAGARVNVNYVGRDGFAPLHRAAKLQRKELIEILYNNGADLNLRTEHGYTALHLVAASTPNIEEPIRK